MIVDELIALLGYKIDDKDELKKFNKGLADIEKKAREVGSAIRSTAMIAGAAFAGGFALLGKSVIDTTAKFETYLTTLETIEGSAEKAKESLDWVTKFAKTTPFDLDQATEAFVKLKAYGIDPLKDNTLGVIGDTASAMGKDLMQAVEAWADAMTGENERLKEFGVKAKKEGEQITYTWTEQGKEVKKTIKDERSEILKFLNETMGKKFKGAMDRQSKTWKGMVSNLGDTWMGFMKAIGDAGIFENVKGRLKQLLDLFDRWADDGTMKKWADLISRNMVRVADAFALVANRIAVHSKFIIDNWGKLATSAKALAVAIGILFAIMFRWVTVLVLLVAALDDFMTYMEGGESVIGNFIEYMKKLIPGSEEVKDALAKMSAGVIAAMTAAFVIAPRTLVGLLVRGLVTAFALLATPAGWAVILAGVGAALVYYFWDDIKKYWDELDFTSLGAKLGNGILDGLKSVGGAIRDYLNILLPADLMAFLSRGNKPLPGAGPVDEQAVKQGVGLSNVEGNLKKTMNGGTVAPVTNDYSQDNREYPVTVQAPVTVTVNGAEGAGSQVGAAVGAAIQAGIKAQPSRMQTGPAQ